MLKVLALPFAFILLLLAACSPERKLANDYVKQHNGNGVMIIPLYELIKDNRSINFDTAVKYTPEQFDSIAWEQSCFIKHVSDSVFLTTFTNSMIDKLTTDGYDVYVDAGSDVFLSLPDPKWVIQIAQLQLDEEYTIDYLERYSAETGEPLNEGVGYRVNQVSLSSWIEASRANTGIRQVLYLNAYMEDYVKHGVKFDMMEDSVGLYTNRDSIQMDDVYKMAFDLGQKHAELLFDYFLNDYIRTNMPSGIIKREYFRFDRKSKSVKKGLKERFEVVN
jgi:hypothetical protein